MGARQFRHIIIVIAIILINHFSYPGFVGKFDTVVNATTIRGHSHKSLDQDDRFSSFLPKANLHERHSAADTGAIEETIDSAAGFSLTLSKREKKKATSLFSVGTITTLDDPRFSQEIATQGYWEPLKFIKNQCVGLYFLHAYDPEKTPILFVHGSVSTPRIFKFIIENVDRRKFQTWFYYYPTGLSLSSVSKPLNTFISDLNKTFGFRRLCVIGHHTGGLVARSFILQNIYEDHQDYIKLFISIATPWNGEKLAKKAIHSAPAVVPSLHDLVPNSPFIQHLFSKRLTPHIDFYLIYAKDYELQSQLDLRSQKEAKKEWGFAENTVSILSSQDVLVTVQRLIEKTCSKR